MPPSITFSKEDVVNAALELVSTRGIGELSSRNVAEILKSSTAPVYSYFDSMEELRQAVLKKAKSVLFKYTHKEYTNRPVLNIGLGICSFAKDYKEFYRMIFLEQKYYGEVFQEYINLVKGIMNTDNRYGQITAESREFLLSQLWTFTFGYATMLCLGIADHDEEKIKVTLMTAGNSLVDSSWMGSILDI